MNETVEHEALENDIAKAIGEHFAHMNLQSLSFVQLRRLQKMLKQAVAEVAQEINGRAKADNFGDTITVPPQEF
ncbi:MAG: hypothetical protein ACR2Q3_04980 [Woeseiaceae bacterium]